MGDIIRSSADVVAVFCGRLEFLLLVLNSCSSSAGFIYTQPLREWASDACSTLLTASALNSVKPVHTQAHSIDLFEDHICRFVSHGEYLVRSLGLQSCMLACMHALTPCSYTCRCASATCCAMWLCTDTLASNIVIKARQ